MFHYSMSFSYKASVQSIRISPLLLVFVLLRELMLQGHKYLNLKTFVSYLRTSEVLSSTVWRLALGLHLWWAARAMAIWNLATWPRACWKNKTIRVHQVANIQNANGVMLDRFFEVALLMPLGTALAFFDGSEAPFPRGVSSGWASYKLFCLYVAWDPLPMGRPEKKGWVLQATVLPKYYSKYYKSKWVYKAYIKQCLSTRSIVRDGEKTWHLFWYQRESKPWSASRKRGLEDWSSLCSSLKNTSQRVTSKIGKCEIIPFGRMAQIWLLDLIFSNSDMQLTLPHRPSSWLL